MQFCRPLQKLVSRITSPAEPTITVSQKSKLTIMPCHASLLRSTNIPPPIRIQHYHIFAHLVAKHVNSCSPFLGCRRTFSDTIPLFNKTIVNFAQSMWSLLKVVSFILESCLQLTSPHHYPTGYSDTPLYEPYASYAVNCASYLGTRIPTRAGNQSFARELLLSKSSGLQSLPPSTTHRHVYDAFSHW